MAEKITLSKRKTDGVTLAHAMAAGMAADSEQFGAIARKVYSEVQARAEKVKDTGDFAKSITMEVSKYEEVEDRVIYSDDPAAYAIERGFRRTKKDGTVVHVPGKHVFQGVLDGGI